uniref:HAT C-terminal dimerisation domain-containing protein n=1 Tax=Phlebotomus papatasi TaxID=29031 RepID=A0A1B0D3I3_PHLPP
MFSKEEKAKTIEYVAARVENSREREVVEDDEVEPKKSRMDTVSDFFEPSHLGELENYKALAVGDDESFALLPWWESQKKTFPKLYKLSKFIFAVPASSAPSERTSDT